MRIGGVLYNPSEYLKYQVSIKTILLMINATFKNDNPINI